MLIRNTILTMKLRGNIFIGLLLFVNLLLAQDYDPYKLTSDLQTVIANNPDTRHRVFLLMEEQVDFVRLKENFKNNNTSLANRSATVIAMLKENSTRTQRDMLNFLENNPGVNSESIRSFWVSNALFAEVTTEVLKELTLRPDLQLIEAEKPVKAIGYERTMGPFLQPEGIETGLRAINAPAMWELGYTGYGLTALIMDTGTSPHHPALRNNYLGLYKPLEEVWSGIGDEPFDCDDHGTHVAGTVLGLDRLNNDTIGVAFNGMWTAAPPIGCGFQSTNLGVIETYEWSLDPDNNPATNDAPSVINNSWGFGGESNGEECNSIFSSTFEALEAAGIANVFAAGNDGPGVQTLLAPQNINVNLVNCFTVAALQGNNPNLPAADFSSRGPSICGGTESLLIKPEVSAPGVSVRSSVANGFYDNFSGTSMASPHVAGAVLLLREAFPMLTGEDILLALYFSCRDLGAPGEDNTFGMGVIDVKAAYDYLVAQGIEPVPGGVENDVMLLDIDAARTFCGDNFNVEFLFENGGREPLTEFEVTYQLVGAETFNGTANWSGSLNSGERAMFTVTGNDIVAGTYEMTLEVGSPNGTADPRPLNNRLLKQVIIVDEAPLSPQQLTTGNICENGQVVLAADLNETGVVEWYANSTTSIPLGSGTPWTTPPLTENTTFWADAKIQQSLGPNRDELTETTPDQTMGGMVFDVFTPFTLKSVMINMPEAGFLVVRAENGRRSFVGTRIFDALEAGPQRIELDFDFSEGEDQRLFVRLVGPQHLTALANAAFPYRINGVVDIKGNDFNDNNFYYFFDWEIEYQQLCGRVPVTVEIEGASSLTAGFTVASDTVDVNETVAFTNNSVDGVSYLWDFGDGATSTDASPSYTFNNAGNYPVILTVTGADGCTSATTRQITVLGEITAIKSDQLNNQIDLFPNPATDQLTISFELDSPERLILTLVDLSGVVVKTITPRTYLSGAFMVDISKLPVGIYYLKMNNEELQVVKKLIIMR